MNLSDTAILARAEMDKHGLIAKGWRFDYHESIHTFGWCRYKIKTITLSRQMVLINSAEEVLDTIRHEIAHVLTGAGRGHGRMWKLMCLVTGAKPERLYDGNTVNAPRGKYNYKCSSCDYTVPAVRKWKRSKSCSYCTERAGLSGFQPQFLMVLEEQGGNTRCNQER